MLVCKLQQTPEDKNQLMLCQVIRWLFYCTSYFYEFRISMNLHFLWKQFIQKHVIHGIENSALSGSLMKSFQGSLIN